MQTECTPGLFEFEAVGRRVVAAQFAGGTITSTAGALLSRPVDRGLGLIQRFAQCFTNRRDPHNVEHRVETWSGSAFSGWCSATRTSTFMTNRARLTAAARGLRSVPLHRTRRALLHLSRRVSHRQNS